jgi:MFS family permease
MSEHPKGASQPEAGATLPVSPTFLARIFRAFRYRDFRLMWMGACASTIGTFVQQFAQSWLVYELTKDPFYLGLDLFLGQLPIIMFSLFGGVFADRMDRRKMLLASQYIQMACAFLLSCKSGTSWRSRSLWD